MVKSISLLTRKPGMTHEQFMTHWVEIHAPLAHAVPGLRRYVQSHIREQPTRPDIPTTEVDVDGIAELVAREDLTEMARLTFRAPPQLSRFIAPKGSVALDGVSLTVNEAKDDRFEVLIIPHTLEVTTFGALRAGDTVNLEVDLMARYAARLIERR